MSIKALIDNVLERVAIDGEDGTSVQDLFRYVEEFYGGLRLEKWDLQRLAAAGTEESNQTATSILEDDVREQGRSDMDDEEKKKDEKLPLDLWGKPNVKAEFQDHIWEQLKKERDLIMGIDNKARDMSLKEVVERLRKGDDDEKSLRVYTTVHRRWVVLTGHAPDSKRVPNALYKCLEEIARHGEKGIIQPELTRLTGQDKRSIAGRTTQLAELGYIEKIGVLVTSMNTSKLTLAKFAARRDYKLELQELQKGKTDAVKSTFTGDVIYSAELVRAVMHELKQAKSGVLLRHDLKIKLGMHKSTFHSRTLSRLLRRVECLGVWRRIKVPLSINRTVRGKNTGDQAVVEKCHARCIKYLRDLTEDDWKMIGNSTRPAIAVEEDDQDDGAISEAEAEKEAKQLDAEAAKQLETTNADAVPEESRQLPIWTPYLPVPNLVYHAIDKSGEDGLSSMELMAKVIGGFYYRPMDQVLHRLTDLPSKSQPVGYIHLAIIRETSISHRQTHYRYFTYDAHQGLVKKGLASDPWEIKPKIKIKGVKSGSGTADQVPIAELDENGFPLPDISRLLHGTGAATLKDIQTAITAKEKVETYTNQCSIKVGPDGKEHIDWKNVGYGHGRPRKYEKGKEPYLAARRRREELGLPPPKRGRPKGRKDSIKRASKKRDSTQSAPPEAEALKIQEVPHEESQHNNTWTPSTETPAQGASGLAATPAPKRRGRPPKNIQTETPVAADTPSLPTATPIPKKRGRPAKSATAAPAAPTLIPHTEAAEEPPSVAVTTPAPKRRGRPPKNPPPQTPIATIQIPETPITAPTTRSTAKRKAAATPTPVATRQSKRARTITDFFTPVSRASGFIAVNTVETQEPSTKDVPESRDLSKPTETPKLDQTPVAPRKRTAEKTPTKSQHKKRKRGDDPPPEPVLESAQQTQQPPEVEPARNVPPQDQETMQQGSTKELDIPGATMQDVQAEAATSEQNKDHTVSAPVTSETSQTSEVPPLTHEVEGTTLEVEPVEPLEKNAYNLMGGMLALSRQQVVLDLIKEHGGCFPGGLELRHAFNKRYKMKNPKAGDSDRRLVRSVIQSLQYKGKVNQITFTFMNSKQVPCTKKILVDAELSLDNPTVEKMTRDIIAADGNMWYPPGTDLPADIVERMAQPSGRMQASTQVMVEGVQFDRLYPAPIELLKKKRAERAAQRAKQKTDRHEERLKARQERALRKALTAQRTNASAPAFTEEQKAEAAKRKAALKQQTAMYKLNKRFSSRVIAGEQEYGGDSSLPKSIWWNEFVTRHDDTESFLRGVKDVRKWENLITEAGGIDDLTEGVRGQDKLVMINHFGPQVEGQVTQGSVDLDLPPNLSQRAAKRLLKMPALNEEVPKTTRKKRRPKGPSRRSMAMKAIHDQISLELADDGVDFTARKEQVHRNCYTMPKEDEDTLLIAVIIIRMLFGEADRRIRWDLVQKALPHHQMSNLRGRWPRVRDMYRKYLKRIEMEFENLYLEAYEKGEVPPIDLTRPSRFDVPLHVDWFRATFTMPEFNSSIELPASREVFDNLYSLGEEKTSFWKTEYHNMHHTMGARANYFACYAYDMPLTQPTEPTDDVEYAKSIIKANIVTAPESYNPQKAFNILHALPEEAVDEAFYSLSVSKIITHKKEHIRAAPGRNYELSEKFHLSVKRPMEVKHFAQAVRFERGLAKKFEEDGETEVEVSPMVNDGTMAAIFDLMENGRVSLEKRDHQANKWGLIEGYETRSMSRNLVSFRVLVRKEEKWGRREMKPLPPIPGIPPNLDDEDALLDATVASLANDSGPVPNSVITPAEAPLLDGPTSLSSSMNTTVISRNKEQSVNKIPVPVWVDINNAPIPGMWLKVCTAVLCTVTMQSGIGARGLVDMLSPGITMREVEMVLGWLMERGAVVRRGVCVKERQRRLITEGELTRGEDEEGSGEYEPLGYHSCPGYYLALEGL